MTSKTKPKNKRGRKPTPKPQSAIEPINTVALQQAHSAADNLATLQRAFTLEQLTLAEQFGAFRMNRLTRKFLDVIDIRMLIQWKESNSYKGLQAVLPDKTSITIDTFRDLCRALDIDHSTVYEWINNYQALGEDFLKDADAAGIGVRDLRRLRKLPENEIEAAKMLLKSEGKEAVIDFVEDLVAKQAKERQQLEKKIVNLESDAQAHDKLTENKNKKIDELHKKLHQREHTKDWHPRAFEIALETTKVGVDLLNACDRLDALRDSILTEDFGNEDDRNAAIEAMACNYWDIIHQSILTVNDLAHACNEVFHGYKNKARPLLEMADVFGPYPEAK